MDPGFQNRHAGVVALRHRKAMFERGSAALHAVVPSVQGIY